MFRSQLAATSVSQPPPVLPVLLALPRGPATFGMSESTIRRAAAAGEIKLRKIGRATYIDTASMLAHIASLPTV